MILTVRIWVRLVALALLTALIQVACMAKMTPFGSSPDLALLIVMSIGLLGGSLAGGVGGFGIGFLIDVLGYQTLGAGSLALLAVGYVAGRVREDVGRPTRGAVVLLGGMLTLLGTTTFGVIQIGLGLDANVSSLVIRDAFVRSLLGALLALPVYAGARRVLRPALIEAAPRSGKRRDPATDRARAGLEA